MAQYLFSLPLPPLSLLFFTLFVSQVEDINDNAPLTSDPIYHPVIMENSPKDVSVIRIQAQDPDLTATPSRLSYRITAGNPQNFFSINPKTGGPHLTCTTLNINRLAINMFDYWHNL